MFRTRTTPAYQSDELPSGICVSSEGEHWYLNKGFRHKVPTQRILDSWSFPIILPVTAASLTSFKKARPLGFRDGSLVKELSSGRLYLISERRKCPVGNPDFLKALGKNQALLVSDYELSLHAEGGVIN